MMRSVSSSNFTSMRPLKPRHFFTTREVKEALQAATTAGYVNAIVKLRGERCGSNLFAGITYQPYDDVVLPSTVKSDVVFRVSISPRIDIPDTLSRLPAPLPFPAPTPSLPEPSPQTTVPPPVVPILETSHSEEVASEAAAADETAPVNTAVYVKRCRRVRCERERYKKGLCKSHYGAWRKKNPWN